MLLCDENTKDDPACLKALEEAKDGKPGEPALVFDVEEGSIEVKNDAGSKTFEVGQAGVVSSSKSAPQPLPENPGLNESLPSSTAARPGPAGMNGRHWPGQRFRRVLHGAVTRTSERKDAGGALSRANGPYFTPAMRFSSCATGT